MKAIRVSQNGGPEELKYEDMPTPEPKAGEVLIKLTATGVNFIEVYHRLGRYPYHCRSFRAVKVWALSSRRAQGLKVSRKVIAWGSSA